MKLTSVERGMGGVRELKKKEEGKQRLERARIVAFLFV